MLAAALVWGSVWGLGEATLGHLLHLTRVPGLPGLVMFPFGVLVMGRALARSGSATAVFLTGAVAAGFKFLDLLLPGTDILAVINPAQAILLEALAGAVWVGLWNKGAAPLFLYSSWTRSREDTGVSPLEK
jgi:H+/gluconate symporter-like permease